MRFYSKQTGKRVDEIPKKDGKGMKAPNINDAIALGLVPSVTEVINIVSKPFLLVWLQEQAFNSAWDSAHTPASKEDAWAYYQQQSAIVRDKGSDIHDKISRLELTEITKPAIHWIETHYKTYEHEVQFAAETYGGTIDFIGAPVDTVGVYDLVDFKTVTKDRKPYDSELQQLSAYYKHLIAFRKIRKGINLYISQEDGRILSVKEWTPDDIARGMDQFAAISNLWQRLNNYDILNGVRFYE